MIHISHNDAVFAKTVIPGLNICGCPTDNIIRFLFCKTIDFR